MNVTGFVRVMENLESISDLIVGLKNSWKIKVCVVRIYCWCRSKDKIK